MSVFKNALLTAVWLFTIIMCADIWSEDGIEATKRIGMTGLFIATAVIAHIIIKRILGQNR